MADSKNHVLVVEDNDDILLMLKAMLTHRGFQVTTSVTTDNLESTITEAKPDVILMDMLLSGNDGRDVCRSLKSNSEFSSIPIVMISAHPQAKEECLKAGADFFIPKPFEMKDLLSALTQATFMRNMA